MDADEASTALNHMADSAARAIVAGALRDPFRLQEQIAALRELHVREVTEATSLLHTASASNAGRLSDSLSSMQRTRSDISALRAVAADVDALCVRSPRRCISFKRAHIAPRTRPTS
jgi:hypothetical protein